MALTLSDAVANASTDARTALVDAGSTNASGRLILKDASDTVLVTLELSNPAFGAAVAGTAAANTIASVSASATGTASKYEVVDRDGTLLWSGVVTSTGNGGDLELSTTAIVEGTSVSITNWSHSTP